MYSQKVNEKPQVINDYEAGRGIPNQVVIGKIEKAIGKWSPVQDDHRMGKGNSTGRFLIFQNYLVCMCDRNIYAERLC
jgi:hypothetical protein